MALWCHHSMSVQPQKRRTLSTEDLESATILKGINRKEHRERKSNTKQTNKTKINKIYHKPKVNDIIRIRIIGEGYMYVWHSAVIVHKSEAGVFTIHLDNNTYMDVELNEYHFGHFWYFLAKQLQCVSL